MEIVGVVGGVRYTGLDSDPADAYYQPYGQTLYYQRTNLVVRSNGPARFSGPDPPRKSASWIRIR